MSNLCSKCESKISVIGGLCETCFDAQPESKKIEFQAACEESDYKALSLHTKSIRQARLERFEDYIVPLEKKNCIVIPFNGQKVVIDTQTDTFGIIDYFPKANKLLIRKTNDWKTQGLKWLNINIIQK
jgi:hypothetical protein